MYIRERFKPIFPLFLTSLLHKVPNNLVDPPPPVPYEPKVSVVINLYAVGTKITPMNRCSQHFPPVGQFPYSIFPYVPVKSNGHSVYGKVGCDNLCYRKEIWAYLHRPEGAEVANCSRRDRNSSRDRRL